MKTILLSLFICFLSYPYIYSKQTDEPDDCRYNTNITIEGYSYRVGRICPAEFKHLQVLYEPGCLITGITGIDDILQVLGENYSFTFKSNLLYEEPAALKKDGQDILLFDEDCGCPCVYYPEFGILGYRGDHECDFAFNVITGEYTDEPWVVAPDRFFLLTAMDNGHEGITYIIKRWDTGTRTYRELLVLSDIIYSLKSYEESIGCSLFMDNPYAYEVWEEEKFNYIPYGLQNIFWYDDKLYFSKDGNCMFVTFPRN